MFLSITSSFWRFIVSCCYLISLDPSKYSFFRRIIQVWYQCFQISVVPGQFPHKHFLYCPGSACSDFTEGYGSSTRVVSEKFLLFYFPFSQFPTIKSTIFFLKFVIYLIISEVRFHFQCYRWWVYYRLNYFKLTVWSTTISHHWWPWSTMQSTFISTQLFHFPKPFHIPSINHYKPFIKSMESWLFCHKYWLNHLSAIW